MNILYIVPAMYPFGWAYAARALNITRLMTASGHNVTVLCDYLSDGIEKKDELKYEDANIVVSTGKYASERNFKDKLFVNYTMKKTLLKYLKEHIVDCIVCSMTGGKFSKAQKVANKKGIPIILEICEWYSYKNWTFGKKDPRYWRFQYDWKFTYPKATKVLCISRLLKQHFSRSGVTTVRIPTILDTNKIPYKDPTKLHMPIKLVFIGGITGGKDELSTLIETVCNENLPFEIDIYGPTETAILKTLSDYSIDNKVFEEKIHIHGFVKQQLIDKIILKSDYGILIRPNRRSSNAGFPTKLGEYFAAGIPVIANDTGDIGLYLKNLENGLILQGNDRNSIHKALLNIVEISNDKYIKMSECARNTAENYFDYRKYLTEFGTLIAEVGKKTI